MISRRLVSMVVALTFAVAPRAGEPLTPHIAIVVNGQELSAEPSPRVVHGRILVPFVHVLSALAIAVIRDGSTLIAQAPTKTIRITRGTTRAFIDNRPVRLEMPPVEIGGTTYVPLRLLVDALGASVSYNSRRERLEIVSALVRRETASTKIGAGKTKITGTLTALDTLSQPPSMTVTYRGSVRTIAVNSTAKVTLSDVVARTEQNGQLSDLHVGDAVAVTLSKDGVVELIQDMYGSRAGTIAAVSPTAIVLENGRVVTPDRSTEITLNGEAAKVGDLHVGDAITQRMNPETGETRQIIALRRIEAAATPSAVASGPAEPSPAVAAQATIYGFAAEPARPLKLGEKFDFTLRGTPGGKATFDIGTFIAGQAMREEQPGVYKGSFAVAPGMNFTLVPVYGRLFVGDAQAPRQQATNLISAATIAPQITDVAPGNGQVVNNSKPSIYATFAAPTDVGIDPRSVTLKVNGSDVTSSVTRTGSFVTYTSGAALPDGPVSVSVAVADFAGNTASRSWTFTIRTR
jgi:copper amine oxidase-like protein